MITLSFVLALSASPAFDAAKSKATEIESLKKTVSALAGVCDVGDQLERADCKRTMKTKAAKIRKAGDVYLYLGRVEDGLRFEGERGGKVRVLWTPIVDAGDGLAITLDKPSRQTRSGNIVVRTRPFDLKLPADVFPNELQRGVRTGNVNVEVVGAFGPTWSIGRGSRKVQGVRFELKALRLSKARSGQELGVWLP